MALLDSPEATAVGGAGLGALATWLLGAWRAGKKQGALEQTVTNLAQQVTSLQRLVERLEALLERSITTARQEAKTELDTEIARLREDLGIVRATAEKAHERIDQLKG